MSVNKGNWKLTVIDGVGTLSCCGIPIAGGIDKQDAKDLLDTFEECLDLLTEP